MTWLQGPQARPQWFTSLFVLKQPPPQQVAPAPQVPPQRPQFVELVFVSTQVPPQQVSPAAQAAPAPQRHAPLLHESARARSHAMPHCPQLLMSC
jgi:hypothetical protein